MAKYEAKTVPTGAEVQTFLDTVEHSTRKSDAEVLNSFFHEITGWEARMWGPSIIGYGSYDYTYESGHSGTFLATGFSPRKANLSIYVMPGYANFQPILDRLGKHKMGKSCLYINKLADVDMDVLAELIRAGLGDLQAKYPVTAS